MSNAQPQYPAIFEQDQLDAIKEHFGFYAIMEDAAGDVLYKLHETDKVWSKIKQRKIDEALDRMY